MGFQVTTCRVGIGKEPSCPHKVLSALAVRMLLHPLLGCLKELLSVALDCSSPSHDFPGYIREVGGWQKLLRSTIFVELLCPSPSSSLGLSRTDSSCM